MNIKSFCSITLILAISTLSAIGQTNTYPDDGNVGIGTLSPAGPLHIKGDIFLERGNELNFYADGYGLRAGLAATAGNALQFFTGAHAEAMRITAEGRVGIGTSNPNAPLEIAGDAIINGDMRINGGLRYGFGYRDQYAYSYHQNAVAGNDYVIFDITGDSSNTYSGLSFAGTLLSNNSNWGAMNSEETRFRGYVKFSGTQAYSLEVQKTISIHTLKLRKVDNNKFQVLIHSAESWNEINVTYQITSTNSASIVPHSQNTLPDPGTDVIEAATSWAMRADGKLTLTKGDGSTNGLGRIYGGTDGNDYIDINGEGGTDHIRFVSGSERMRINGINGNIGMGTNNPGSLLTLEHSTDPTISLRGKTYDQVESGRVRFLEFGSHGFLGSYIHYNAHQNKPHLGVHHVNNSNFNDDLNAISINRSNGFVGIGTENPSHQLSVAGTIESKSGGIKFPDGTVQASAVRLDRQVTLTKGDGSTNGLGRIYGGTDGNDYIDINGEGSTDHIRFVSSSERLRINGINGNVGIGTIDPVEKLHVAGNISILSIIFVYFLARV